MTDLAPWKRGAPPPIPPFYVAAMRANPPLTTADEHELARRARGGDTAAAHALVRHNLGLVFVVLRRFWRPAADLDDLVQEGNAGLVRAVETFDPGRGIRFGSYASWWVRAYVGRYLHETRSLVQRAPRHGPPAADESLDVALSDDTDETFLSTMPDDRPGPDAAAEERQIVELVRSALATVTRKLDPMRRDVVWNRLLGHGDETLQAIGARHGVSREAVRQAEVRLIRTVRYSFASRGLGRQGAVERPRPPVRPAAAANPVDAGERERRYCSCGCGRALHAKNRRGISSYCGRGLAKARSAA